ncbi:uncharacterized protein LOC135121351 [Zophobas morio]|jgi:RNA recognition motif-containing protein|uniref:uncharacterized protein LOC135121351 n=1 Tax=Zophobas morio TaxID=2755281 RepID=UPI0030830733
MSFPEHGSMDDNINNAPVASNLELNPDDYLSTTFTSDSQEQLTLDEPQLEEDLNATSGPIYVSSAPTQSFEPVNISSVVSDDSKTLVQNDLNYKESISYPTVVDVEERNQKPVGVFDEKVESVQDTAADTSENLKTEIFCTEENSSHSTPQPEEKFVFQEDHEVQKLYEHKSHVEGTRSPRFVPSARADYNNISESEKGSSVDLFIANISPTLSHRELVEAISQYCRVLKVSIATHPSGQIKNFGFVTVPSEQDAALVIEKLNNIVLAGRPIVIEKAKNKKRENFHPSFGHRGGYRGPPFRVSTERTKSFGLRPLIKGPPKGKKDFRGDRYISRGDYLYPPGRAPSDFRGTREGLRERERPRRFRSRSISRSRSRSWSRPRSRSPSFSWPQSPVRPELRPRHRTVEPSVYYEYIGDYATAPRYYDERYEHGKEDLGDRPPVNPADLGQPSYDRFAGEKVFGDAYPPPPPPHFHGGYTEQPSERHPSHPRSPLHLPPQPY